MRWPHQLKAKTALPGRLKFLNKCLHVHPGHWGGWHIETHPEVHLIGFDENRTKATIYFQLFWRGGEAFMEKRDGKSGLKSSKLT